MNIYMTKRITLKHKNKPPRNITILKINKGNTGRRTIILEEFYVTLWAFDRLCSKYKWAQRIWITWFEFCDVRITVWINLPVLYHKHPTENTSSTTYVIFTKIDFKKHINNIHSIIYLLVFIEGLLCTSNLPSIGDTAMNNTDQLLPSCILILGEGDSNKLISQQIYWISEGEKFYRDK